MMALVWATVALVGLSALVASRCAARAPWALGAAAVLNAALEAGHARFEIDHPVRLAGPVLMMAIAYVDMLEEGAWSRAYAIAWLTFALGGSATMAPIAFMLWGQWALPVVTIVFCAAICAASLLPERGLLWLLRFSR